MDLGIEKVNSIITISFDLLKLLVSRFVCVCLCRCMLYPPISIDQNCCCLYVCVFTV